MSADIDMLPHVDFLQFFVSSELYQISSSPSVRIFQEMTRVMEWFQLRSCPELFVGQLYTLCRFYIRKPPIQSHTSQLDSEATIMILVTLLELLSLPIASNFNSNPKNTELFLRLLQAEIQPTSSSQQMYKEISQEFKLR